MASFRMVLIVVATMSAMACASSPGPQWQGTGGVSAKRTQATVIVDGKHTQVTVICSRGC